MAVAGHGEHQIERTGATSARYGPVAPPPGMDLVKADPQRPFNDPEWPFYTHPRDLPGSSQNAVRINRSIVSEGTMLEECTAGP